MAGLPEEYHTQYHSKMHFLINKNVFTFFEWKEKYLSGEIVLDDPEYTVQGRSKTVGYENICPASGCTTDQRAQNFPELNITKCWEQRSSRVPEQRMKKLNSPCPSAHKT